MPCYPSNDYRKLADERYASLSSELKEYYAKAARPPLRQLGVAGMRERWNARVGPAEIDPEVRQRDIVIDGPHGRIPIRIFTPAKRSDRPRGIYLHTHGGGYVMGGGLDAQTNINNQIAKATDCIVVSPDFRLPPEHPFPVPLDDCYTAFRWTAENAQDLGGHPAGICVGGGCTGANLAAAVTIMARDKDGPKLGAQYLIAPVFDLRGDYLSHQTNSDGFYTLSHDDCMFVYEQYLQDMTLRYDPRASVVLAESLVGLPPTHIHVGEWDVLRDESRAYAARLRDARVDVTFVEAQQESHGPTTANARTIMKQMAEFLARAVGPTSVAQSGELK